MFNVGDEVIVKRTGNCGKIISFNGPYAVNVCFKYLKSTSSLRKDGPVDTIFTMNVSLLSKLETTGLDREINDLETMGYRA